MGSEQQSVLSGFLISYPIFRLPWTVMKIQSCAENHLQFCFSVFLYG